MTNPSIPSPPSDPDGEPKAGELTRVRVIVGAVLALAVCGVVALSYSSGRANLTSEPASRTAPIPDTPALAQAQIDDLTVAADALQPLAPEEARAWNKALPFSSEALRPAPTFISPVDRVAD